MAGMKWGSEHFDFKVLGNKKLMAHYIELRLQLGRDPTEAEFKKRDAKAYKVVLKEFNTFERFAAECEQFEAKARWV